MVKCLEVLTKQLAGWILFQKIFLNIFFRATKYFAGSLFSHLKPVSMNGKKISEAR
jgi:hypothetical protein